MPSPIKPSEVCALVPTGTSSLCDRILKVFLQLPAKFCALMEWMFNEDGTLTENFKNEAQIIPTGTVIARLSTTVPTGWLFCNGAEVSRTTYATLFAVIGTTYGAGNGTTTFNLPDLQSRFLYGKSPATSVGDTGGEETHTLTVPELPAHSHAFTPEVSSDSTPVSLTRLTAGNAGQTFGDGTYATDTAGQDVPHSIMPPHMRVVWLIKT